MGQRCCKECPISKEDLDDFVLLTHLDRSQILSCYYAFEALSPLEVVNNKDIRLPIDTVLNGREDLRQNPFGDRICHAFSSEKDGKLGLEDFIDLFNTMSDHATLELKTHFAFMVYDFDSDGVIGRGDLAKIADRMYHTDEKHLTNDEKKCIVDRVLEEVDVDKDGFICKPEFRFAIARCPDFFNSFTMFI